MRLKVTQPAHQPYSSLLLKQRKPMRYEALRWWAYDLLTKCAQLEQAGLARDISITNLYQKGEETLVGPQHHLLALAEGVQPALHDDFMLFLKTSCP